MTATFAELGLSAKVLAAIEAAGYPAPTPIQAEAIPVAVTGRDVLGIAQTGTGKTASFVLPMITRLETGRARARMPRSLILAPTRELAAQCAQSFEKYGVNHKLSVALLIGGVSMDDQIQKLDRGADVLIATPGRLLDHFGRGRIMLMGVEILVIDEADRMLDMGFIPDIEKICKLLPPRRQTLFFSATMPPEITRLVDQFLREPARIEVARPATTAKTITQRFRFCYESEDWAKREVLRELLRTLDVKNAIIFCNRKKDVAILLKSLTKHGFNAGALHGDMDQMSRMATLDKFRSGEIALLAASDVAARGLDIPDVSHVINFDVPWQPDDYVHRIGRTGRAGREGFSATIVTADDIKSIEAIAKLTNEELVWIGEPPDAATLEEGRSRKRSRSRGRPVAARGRERERPGRGEGRGDRRRPAERPKREPAREERGDRPRARHEHALHGEPMSERAREPAYARDGEPPRRESRDPGRSPERAAPSRRPYADEPSRVSHREHRDPRPEPRRERSRRDFDDVHADDMREHRPQADSDRQRAPERRDAYEDATPGPSRREERRRPSHVAAARDTRSRDHAPRDREPVDRIASTDPERHARPSRAERPRHRADERREHGDEPREQRRKDRGRDRGGDRGGGGSAPVGLGEHVPAFLRRPVRAGN